MPKYKINKEEQEYVNKRHTTFISPDSPPLDEGDKRARDAGLYKNLLKPHSEDNLRIAESHKRAMDRIKEDRIIKNNRGDGTRPWDKE